jgi:hypothetical protein
MSVVGALLTLVGGVTVLVLRDGPTSSSPSPTQPASVTGPGASTATTVPGAPAVNRPPGTIGARPRPGTPVSPASPSAPPPATPEQVAELLAGLPLQLEQAATQAGEPRELPPEEVDKIVEDLLRQLGAQP